MKIAFVSTILHYPWGGADTLWTHAAETAQARGDSLLLLVSPATAGHARLAAPAAAGAQVKLRVTPPAQPGLGARLRRKLGSLFQPDDPLRSALRDFRPDLVIFSQGGTYDFLLEPTTLAWLKDSGTPYRIIANWQAEHASLSESERRLALDGLSRADAVFFVSARNRDATSRHLLAALPNARVVHNPLRWRPADVSPWPTGEWGLATVSRLDRGKGIHLLLGAAEQVLGGEADWHLDIFGQGPDEAYLREAAGQSGLGSRVRFRGYVPELRAIWQENHLMISSAIDEGVPMTIPEAMLCERPVLATCVGGAEEWISDGKTGFLCPAATLPLLAASLARAWEARSRWEGMGRAAAIQAQAFYRRDEHLLLIHPA